MYECSCPDSLFATFACKHAHLVHTNFGKPGATTASSSASTTASSSTAASPHTEETGSDFMEEVVAIGLSSPQRRNHFVEGSGAIDNSNTLENEIAAAVADLQQLTAIVRDLNKVSVVKGVRERLSNAITYAKAFSSKSPVKTAVASCGPPNKKMETQPRFFPVYHTKKRRKVYGRPNEDEIEEIRQTFTRTTSRVCGGCRKEDDGATGNSVNWTACEQCSTWFHDECAIFTNASMKFLCGPCVKKSV